MARISVSRRVTKSPLDIAGPWEYKGSAIPDGSIIDLKGKDDLWAPDVHQLGDWYYLHYAVSSFGSQHSAIGVARSKSMDVGTWKDGGTVVTSDPSKPLNAIDPNLIRVNGEFTLTLVSAAATTRVGQLQARSIASSLAALRKATEGFVDKDGVDCTKGGGTVVLESHDNVYGPGGQGVYDDTPSSNGCERIDMARCL
ncbi:Glycosyl hydrolases family 43 [Phytophthora infestans]|uniref:Endo-1,5-alpha-L-arabinanase A n=1 Tax=Phytophthora infestans TaxID=4787 RepID=A0A833S088_PHYIN|nr:Glycosyl hydrolases family 43 [Phytophthora infestans]